MLKIKNDVIIAEAAKAREAAYAPYSGFKVGAAILCENGEIFSGCNVENSSYGACVCAERAAVCAAARAGRKDFAAIAIVTDCSPPAYPCGLCRQTLAEFNPDIRLVLSSINGETIVSSLKKIHKNHFDGASLRRK